jgi:hypothetical protein
MEGSVTVILPPERQGGLPPDFMQHYIPPFAPIPLAHAKNGNKQLHPANEKVQHALRRSPVFFFWEGWRGAGKGFFVFSLIPNVFPLCSHGVLKGFFELSSYSPRCSQ